MFLIKRILELTRWNSIGQGTAELFAQELSSNEFKPLHANDINKLFKYKKIPLKGISGHNYFVYYECHPSSGYETEIYIGDTGEIQCKTNKPKGGVLCAFTHEVIVFTIVD